MENLFLKDQQIQAQKETIASLERKVESLERELQRYLDPDSGEINPTFKPGQKHGEAGLLEQIASLQKELADCLETSDLGLVQDGSIRSRIDKTISGLFLPVSVYNRRTKEWDDHFQPWWYFRQFLFDCDLFDNHWSSPDFRKGVDALNDMVQATEERPTTLEQLDKFEVAARIFGGSTVNSNQEKSRAIQSLISALLILRANQDHPEIKGMVDTEDFNHMLVSLKIIAYCQRLWIDAKPEKKKEADQVAV